MRVLVVVALGLGLGGCTLINSISRFGDPDAGIDAGDAGTDGGADASIDAGEDAGIDAGVVAAGQLAADGDHTCLRHATGDVSCWGSNADGEIGTGSSGADVLEPASVISLGGGIVHVSLGMQHTCALRGSPGQVFCWGSNEFTQLGASVGFGSAEPVPIAELSSVVELTVGGWHGCVRDASGSVRCWGAGSDGQLGNGSTSDRAAPVTVSIPDIVQLSAGTTNSCARLLAGTVRCWGDDGVTDRSTPTEVSSLGPAVEVSAGGVHACARLSSGRVMCWGDNSFGQLGNAGVATATSTPVEVTGLSGVVDIEAGVFHNCARHADGAVSCWGRNDFGQLGDGGMLGGTTPVTVGGLSDPAELALGLLHSCARLADESVVCWGRNDRGQLGDGTRVDRPAPTAVVGL